MSKACQHVLKGNVRERVWYCSLSLLGTGLFGFAVKASSVILDHKTQNNQNSPHSLPHLHPSIPLFHYYYYYYYLVGRRIHDQKIQITIRNTVLKIHNVRVWSEVQKINQNLQYLHNYRGYSISETYLQGKIPSNSVLNLWWMMLAPRKSHGFSNQTHSKRWVGWLPWPVKWGISHQ